MTLGAELPPAHKVSQFDLFLGKASTSNESVVSDGGGEFSKNGGCNGAAAGARRATSRVANRRVVDLEV